MKAKMDFDLLQSLLDTSSDFMVMLSPAHEVLAYNKAAVDYLLLYFGTPLYIGADYRDFVVPNSMRTYLNAVRTVKTGDTVKIEHKTMTEDVTHWFEYKMSPVFDGKKIIAISLLARNIDLEKAAEADAKYLADTFEVIVQNAEEAIAFLDREARVLQYNNKAKERLFLNYGKKVKIGDDFRQFVYSELVEDFNADFQQTLMGNVCEKEYRTTNVDDVSVWIRVRMYPVCQDGAVIGVTLFVMDILEQKEIETINKIQLEKLRQISWHHSHVLRSPVAKILGITSVLKDDHELDAEQKQRWLNLLLQCTEELDGIIRDVVNKAYLEG